MRVPTVLALHDVQQSFRDVWASVDTVVGRNNIDLNGRRIINAGDGMAQQDYVTLAQLEALDPGRAQGRAQTPRGTGTVLVGIHDERLALAPAAYAIGTGFWETDRAALYLVELDLGQPAWVLALCRPLRTSDTKPSDLGALDAGFTWFSSTEGVTYRWSGGAWNYYLGSVIDVFSARPDPALADRGMLFIATDRGDQVWRKGASAWVLLEGVGGPTRGVISAITGSLTTDDEGYRYHATDYDRVYRWSGSAWADAPGQPMRGMIAYFGDVVLPLTGWTLCSGGTATFSTHLGGTASGGIPDLTTAARFIRSTAGATYNIGGSATTHTHQIDPPDTLSGNNNDSAEVQSGTGILVARDTHGHQVDIAAFTSAGPSGTSGDDALPPWVDLKPVHPVMTVDLVSPLPLEWMPRVWAWASEDRRANFDDGGPTTLEAFTAELMRRSQTERSWGVLADGEPVGLIGYAPFDQRAGVLHGLCFTQSVCGAGVAAVAVRRVFHELFASGVTWIGAAFFVDNVRVHRFLAKLGAVDVGLHETPASRDGQPVVLMLVEILKEGG